MLRVLELMIRISHVMLCFDDQVAKVTKTQKIKEAYQEILKRMGKFDKDKCGAVFSVRIFSLSAIYCNNCLSQCPGMFSNMKRTLIPLHDVVCA